MDRAVCCKHSFYTAGYVGSCWAWDNDCAYSFHHQSGLTHGSAQSEIRDCPRLVPSDELLLLHCDALGICRRALFY